MRQILALGYRVQKECVWHKTIELQLVFYLLIDRVLPIIEIIGKNAKTSHINVEERCRTCDYVSSYENTLTYLVLLKIIDILLIDRFCLK